MLQIIFLNRPREIHKRTINNPAQLSPPLNESLGFGALGFLTFSSIFAISAHSKTTTGRNEPPRAGAAARDRTNRGRRRGRAGRTGKTATGGTSMASCSHQ